MRFLSAPGFSLTLLGRVGAIVALCLVLAGFGAIQAIAQDDQAEQDAQAVEAAIADEQARARQAMEALSGLTSEEEALHGDLAETLEDITDLEARVAEQEQALAEVEAEAEAVRQEHEAILAKRDAAAEELFTLLRGLWPLHVVSLTGRSRDVDTWERADREFTWIAALYKAVHEKFQEVLEQGRRVQESLKEKEELANDIRARIAAVNLDKDALLAVKLDFMTELAEMREEILSQEQAVQLILAAIDDLKYDLQNSRPPEGETLADRKGELAWPVTGEVVAQWAPRQDPPVRGVGIDVEENAAVRSIYWGKVVHDGVLRGFGRVIIVLHDGDYYSLYAFLHDSEVEVGDNVAKEQTLGRAGFYPGADGPGLYFELRKGPQPVNPTEWLGQAG